MPQTLEIVTFRLRDGHEAGFLSANIAVNEWLARQPGFVSRHLSYRRDGNWWIDTVLWENRVTAWQAAEKMMREIGETPAMCAIDPASIDMSHADVAIVHRAPERLPAPANDAA